MEQEKLIISDMSGIEQFGIGMLQKMKQHKLERKEIMSTVADGCAGQLHFLSDQQRKKVNSVHYACVLQAFLIGATFSGFPGMWENYLVYEFETDGVVDAYWTCPNTTGDPWAPVSDRMATGMDGLSLPVCPFGTCTSVPASAGEYFLMGGNGRLGGNWTNLQPLTSTCGLRDQDDCDFSLQQTSCVDSLSSFCSGPDKLACSPLPATKLEDTRLLLFWILNVSGIVTGIVFELVFLSYSAIRSSMLISRAIDLRLTPLNSDRAFVGKMLVRAAFEMGDPEGELMGVDTGAGGGGDESSIIGSTLAALWFKGKVIFTGIALKALTQQWTTYDIATFAKPYSGTMTATMMWDAMTCHCIVKEATLRATGVTTGVEVFNEVRDWVCFLAHPYDS